MDEQSADGAQGIDHHVHRREREIAIRQTLEVISQSRDDEQPVFDVILENAANICNAPLGYLCMATEDRSAVTCPARRGAFSKFGETLDDLQVPLVESRLALARSINECEIFREDDITDNELYRSGDPDRVSMVEDEGARSLLVVPLVSNGQGVGSITLYRREVMPFSDDDVSLVESFAAQAVIAIENVRQFRELQTRLEREAASGEILSVISQSRDDEGPVFDTILENALRLCDADMAVVNTANEPLTEVKFAAGINAVAPKYQPGRDSWPIDSEMFVCRAIYENRTFHTADLKDTDLYRSGDPTRRNLVDNEGMLTQLVLPLTRGDSAIASFSLYRSKVQPFSENEIALLETFAAQAVIAIENVRQFRELQNRLAREGATRQVLEVISQSRDDETPVFDTILENTARLCETDLATLNLMNEDGTHLEYAAHFGRTLYTYEVGADRWSIDSTLQIAQSVREARVVHNVDLRETDLYKHGDKWRRQLADDEGVRSFLTVPLFSPEGKAVGCIGIYRKEVRAFTNDEISLVETFAAQAVIAIENVRQFKALEARTEEVQALNASLEERVEDQVGEIERMGRMKQFLSPAVADAVVTSGDEAMLKSHRRLIATLFCDIRGFTAFCETAEPEETIEVLQTYHQELGNLISAHGGGVDKRMGDGIMVIFNDPLPCDEPAGDAVRLAVAMRLRMIELSKGWKRLGHRLGFGVGVSLGYATIGMVGSEGRYDYTASGTAVNMAARLCDLAEDGEILLSVRARVAVEDDFRSVSAGEVTLKGIREPVEVFKLAEPSDG